MEKKISRHAATAKEMRKVLKSSFPAIKFSVKSECFSGGDSVSVNWINGPTINQVESLLKIYQEGDFDGMVDMYENTNVRNDIPQVKYILTGRKITEDIKENMINKLANEFGIANKNDNAEWLNKFHQCKEQVIYRYLSDVSFA